MRILRADALDDAFFAYREPEDGEQVAAILQQVRERGDAAVREQTLRFDGVETLELEVPRESWAAARDSLDADVVRALERAAAAIRRFAEAQMEQTGEFEIELVPGVHTGQRVLPIERVGVYTPGGRFPLVSSLLMCGIPARVAGVDRVVACSPPTHEGDVHPAIAAAAGIAGVDRLYRVGGVQAIGALAWGTETIERVDKIVGPGNRFVAQAKKEVYGGVGIDMIAGPTEVMIVADGSADAVVVAADLLAQAEHDRDAQAVLVTTSEELAREVEAQVRDQLADLPTREIAAAAIERHGRIVLANGWDQAVEVANRRAPEHLELHGREAAALVPRLRNYGSLFVGDHAAEVLGDYSAGINHTLPTNTTARYSAGLSVRSFLKFPTTLRVTPEGLHEIGPVAEALAEVEGLAGHARAVRRRRE